MRGRLPAQDLQTTFFPELESSGDGGLRKTGNGIWANTKVINEKK